MKRRLTSATRAVSAAAVALPVRVGCAQLEGDAGPTVVVPGSDDCRDRPAHSSSRAR